MQFHFKFPQSKLCFDIIFVTMMLVNFVLYFINMIVNEPLFIIETGLHVILS